MYLNKTVLFRQSIIAASLVAALGGAPSAEAAGLGKVTVLSALGQPLRAELELSATREELATMSVRLAPQAAFQQSGIDYASSLVDLRFTVDKRPNGNPVIKVTSTRPINDPFLDFLVELNWSAGRLLREYTFLLDPPDMVLKAGSGPVSTVEAKPVDNLPGGGAMPAAPLTAAPAAAPAAKLPAATTAPAPAGKSQAADTAPVRGESKEMHKVRPGETLAKIAAQYKGENVSLEQMLLGLYRANPDAFAGQNMNRLKSGAILAVPDDAATKAVPEDEAHRQVKAQAADWNRYRERLASTVASMPERAESADRGSAGRITPKVEDKTPAPLDAAKDQVRVSRNEQARADRLASRMEEERVANERAMREAQERVAALEKNVADLQKLVELKNQKLALLEGQKAAEAAVPPTPAPAPAELPKPAEPPKPAEAAPESKPAPEVKPVEPAPLPPKPPVAPEPDPELEGGLLDNLPEGMLPVAGGGLLALLAGLLVARRRKRVSNAKAGSGGQLSTMTTLPESSVFQGIGGQQVDTTHTPPPSGEFSQTGPGSIDTDEVDPVAEADVYMAYGRDAQAEEILLEALNKDPRRFAIHLKLLEIYQGRKDRKQFEGVATELYAQTGGIGPDWEKAAAMGRALDAGNPLYAPVAGAVPAEEPAPFEPEKTAVLGDAVRLTDTDVRPLTPAEPPAPEVAAEEAPAPATDAELLAVDFDPAASGLGRVDTASSASEAALEFTREAPAQAEAMAPMDFEFEPATPAVEAAAVELAPAELPVEAPVPAPASEDEGLDFDMALTDSTVLGDTLGSFDLSSINLDLAVDSTAGAAAETPVDPQVAAADAELDADFAAHSGAALELIDALEGAKAAEPEAVVEPDAAIEAVPAEAPFDEALREEVTTKLDLAKAYEEMGDLEGARELLAEVMADGPPDLAGEARDILGRIGP